MSDKPKKYPCLKLVPEKGDDKLEKDVDVRIISSADEVYGHNLCTIRKRTHVTPHYWSITKVYPEKFNDAVRYLKFPDENQAAHFCWVLVKTTEEITKSRPLPNDVTEFLTLRARQLSEERRRLISQFHQIDSELYALGKMAERNQIEPILWSADQSDGEQLVNDLLDFMVSVKGEKEEVPLASEAAAYVLFGKEEGRTFLHLLSAVCHFIAPHITRI